MHGFAIPDELKQRLDILAQETGKRVEDHLESAVRQYLHQWEQDRQSLDAAMAALDEIERNMTFSLEELEANLSHDYKLH
ncbi:MAG: hypothetical protein HQL53_00490 [Magnetococcales bacterium]|nr:hypothetical protein [Magnetococcales bacterium]